MVVEWGQTSFETSLFERSEQTEKPVQTEFPIYSLPNIDEAFCFQILPENKNSQSRTYTYSLNYCTVSGKDIASGKHKSCCTTKAKMNQVNDVTSPPPNSSLSERYDEVIILKYLNETFSYM